MRRAPLLRRLAGLLLTVAAVHALAFLLMRGARGGPFDAERALPPAVRAALERAYHLDDPLPLQYLRSLGGLLRGDFGPSLAYRDATVGRLLAEGLPVSLLLGCGGLLVAVLLGLPAGLWAARRRGRVPDHLVLAGSTVAMAVPNFVLGGLGILLFAFTMGWLPAAGSGTPLHFVLPALCLGLPYAAQVARLTRTGALEALASDPVRSARAKGLAEGPILRRHVLPQALVPVVAFLGPAAAGLLTGSLVIEQVFALPGLGAHFVQAALNRDYPLALGATVVYTALLGAFSLAADLAVQRLDPRVEALS